MVGAIVITLKPKTDDLAQGFSKKNLYYTRNPRVIE